MPVERSRIHKVGGSYMLVLPMEWIRETGLKEGDKVTLLLNKKVLIDPTQIPYDFIKTEIKKTEKELEVSTE